MSQRQQTFGGTLERAAHGLVRTCELPDAARLCELDFTIRRFSAGGLIGRPGAPPHPLWVLDGWACSACVLPDGRRQIVAFAVPGDVVQPPALRPGWGLRSLTILEAVDFADLTAPASAQDTLRAAARRSAALALTRRYDHMIRLASRSPLSRIASLMIELHDRLDAVGLVRAGEFALPLRHEEFADALGLSTVHVTRCLRIFRERGLFTLRFRRVQGFDRAGLLALREE